MTIERLWNQYQTYTRDVTENARTLALAGIGICWMLRTAEFVFPQATLWALCAFVVFFALDVLQSAFGGEMIHSFTRGAERKLWEQTNTVQNDAEVDLPGWVDAPARTLYWLKVAALMTGYGLLMTEILGRP